MTKKDKKLLLYIVENDIDAQFRYQVKNVAETIKGSGRYEVIWFLKSEIKKAAKRLDEASLVVIERQTAKDNEVLDFIKQVQKEKIKTLFSLDDLIFDYRDLSILMSATGSKNMFYWVGYIWGIRRIAKKVDGFLATNDFLARKLRRSFGKPVKVIRNSLNKEQVRFSEKILRKREEQKGENKKFIIGYFSGSPTHKKDFQIVEPEIIKFLEMYNNAELRVVGYMKFSKRMQKLIDAGRVKITNPVDYLKLQELISVVDVNIAPLVVNDFTNCKSELKFFEAAAVETTTIASPTYTFKKAIKDGKNGFLAQPGEWYDKLEYLYKHPRENQKIAKVAREYALKHYYGKEFLEEVEKAYDFFAK